MRVFSEINRLLLAVCLLVLGVASVARADDLLQSYDIRDAVEHGVVEKFHEDDRGIYYLGAYQWNDPQYDPDYELYGIFGFMKPQGPEGHLLYGTEFEGNLHGAQQPLFNLADSEIDYFNAVLLPRVRAAAPWIDELGSIDMRGYALGTHFEDSADFSGIRADHRILPEEPLFGISWRRNDQSRYVPHYEVTGDAGIAVANWPYEDVARKFWTTVASARTDRKERGTVTHRSTAVARQATEEDEEDGTQSAPNRLLKNLDSPYEVLNRVHFCRGMNSPDRYAFNQTPELKEWEARLDALKLLLIRWTVAWGYSLRDAANRSGDEFFSTVFDDLPTETLKAQCTQDLARIESDFETNPIRYGKDLPQIREMTIEDSMDAITRANDSPRSRRGEAAWCYAFHDFALDRLLSDVDFAMDIVVRDSGSSFSIENLNSGAKFWSDHSENLWDGAADEIAQDVSFNRSRVKRFFERLWSDRFPEAQNRQFQRTFLLQEVRYCSHAADIRK